MTDSFPSLQPKGTRVELKRAMCHIRSRCFILAILACLPTMRTPAAQAQTARSPNRWSKRLMFGGLGSGHYAFISQGRPLKVVGKN
jgi:hypothetical protein